MATRCYNCNKEIGPTEPFVLYRSVIEFFDGHARHTHTDDTVRVVCIACGHGAAEHPTRFPHGVGKES